MLNIASIIDSKLLAELQALSAPIYFVLAIILPFFMLYVIVKAITINRVLKNRLYRMRVYGTVITFISSMIYVELHSVAVILNLPFVPYGLDNISGAVALIGMYILTDSFISVILHYDFTKMREIYLRDRKIARSSLLFSVLVLLLATFFLTSEIYNLFIILFGLGLIIFFIFTLVIINTIKDKLDYSSSVYLNLLSYLFIAIILTSSIDTIIDIFDLPIFLNIIRIPCSFLAMYAVYNGMQTIIEMRKIGKEMFQSFK